MHCRIPILEYRSVVLKIPILLFEINHALWSDLAHNLANLFLLSWGEIDVRHCECLELSLPCEDDKQGAQALVGTFKPILLHHDGEALQGVELSIGKCLEELGAI